MAARAEEPNVLSCRDVVARASGLVDGDLTLRDRLGVRLHLAMCDRCRRFTRHLRALTASLRRRDRLEDVDPGFVARVVERAIESTLIEADSRRPADS